MVLRPIAGFAQQMCARRDVSTEPALNKTSIAFWLFRVVAELVNPQRSSSRFTSECRSRSRVILA